MKAHSGPLPVCKTVQMSPGQREEGPNRHDMLKRALLLSYISICWGVLAGAVAITSGLLAGSLGVLGLGLNVLADVGGSIGLVWRFRVERGDPERGHRAEARASMIVAAALGVVAVTLAVAAVDELRAGSAPKQSLLAMITAGVAAVALVPLGIAKHRTGDALKSHALKGDGTLSGIGAGLGVIALFGLLANEFLGWWWADRVAALGIAAIAGAEVVRVLRERPRVVSSAMTRSTLLKRLFSQDLSRSDQETSPWGLTANQFCVIALMLCLAVSIADAVLGHRIILIGLLIVGPCCVIFGGRWFQTAIVGVAAVGLGVVLSIPDGIWGSAAQLELVGAVFLVALVSTFGAAIVEARGPSH